MEEERKVCVESSHNSLDQTRLMHLKGCARPGCSAPSTREHSTMHNRVPEGRTAEVSEGRERAGRGEERKMESERKKRDGARAGDTCETTAGGRRCGMLGTGAEAPPPSNARACR